MSGLVAVACYGGGVNTMAMLIGLYRRGERPDAVIFSDTGGEKPETYEYISHHAAPWLHSQGAALTVISRHGFAGVRNLRTGDLTLEDECGRLGAIPSRAFGVGTCASKWKLDPQKWWVASWEPARRAWALGGKVTRLIGFDAGEDKRARPEQVIAKGYTPDRYPLREWGWDRARCLAEIAAAGLPAPPKSSCFFCPASTTGELESLASAHPDLLARALAMEAAWISTHGQDGVKGLGRRFAWRDWAARSPEGRRALPQAPVEPCMVCMDEDPDQADD